MLSTETASDPSSSTTKFLAVKTDERAPVKLSFPEADPPEQEETASPNFCIRDYVFSSRCKGIWVNWPFTKDLLHLCLKHSIKVPLPPFETPALVRTRCLVETRETAQLIAWAKGEKIVAHNDVLKSRDIGLSRGHLPSIRDDSCLQSTEVVLECSDQDKNLSVEDGKSAMHLKTSLSRGLYSLTSILENCEPVDTAKRLCQRLEKKCKLPLKFGAISGKNWAEDIPSNSSIMSDSMASKACPVCKTFFSTSNTTLNAHIDQCLSMESSTNEVVLGKFPKLNVKPRKRRLMVDIYKTASHCTLEDLDRRNGTNWAMEAALLAPSTTEVVPITASDTKLTSESTFDKKEGAVYVESKGIKLRILPSFNDIPLPSKDLELQIHKKDLSSRKNYMIEKRKNCPLKHSTKMKLKGQKRKLSSFSLQKKQIPKIPGGDGKNQKRQRQVMNRKSRVFCQMSCYPNPDSSQKPVGNCVEKILPRCDLPVILNQLDLSNMNSMRKHHKRLSRPPENLTHSTKRKIADFLPITVQTEKTTDLPAFHSRSSANGLKLSSSENRTSWSKRKVNIPSCTPDDSSGMTVVPSENCQSFLNGQMNSTSKNSESREYDESEKISVYNKFLKHKSNSRTARRRRGLPPPYNVGDPRISKYHGLDLGKKANPQGSCQSSFSECIEMSNTREIMNQLSPGQRDIQECGEREHSNTMDEEKNSSNRRRTRNKCQMQVEISDSEIHNVGNNIINLKPATSSGVQMDSFMEGHHYTLSGNKTSVQHNHEYNVQYIHHGDISYDELVNQDTERGDETSVREVNDSWSELPNKCHGNAVVVQQCASSLTSLGDLGFEMHSKNSLTTSVCQRATHDKSSANEHEKTSSPVSTASAVSIPPPNDPKSNESQVELMKNSVLLHNRLCTEGLVTENSQATQGRNIDGSILEAKEALRGDQPGYIFNDSFCCSCKESLPAESQLFRSNDTSRTAEAHQISDSFTGPKMSLSSTAYQKITTKMTSTTLESHSFGTAPKNLVDSDVTYPVFMDLGFNTPSHSQSQPPSNSVLRLMGKNLMVVNDEEFLQPQTATSDHSPTVNYLSPAFVSTNHFLNQESFLHHHHHQPTLIGSSASSSHSLPIGDGRMHQQYVMAASGSFVGYPYCNNWVRIQDQQSQKKKPNKRLDPCPAAYML